MFDTYDRKGNPISHEKFNELFHDKEYRILLKTKFHNKTVSTVWLGVDHGLSDGKPLIFETMILPDCVYCEKYTNEDDAIKGHEKAERYIIDDQIYKS